MCYNVVRKPKWGNKTHRSGNKDEYDIIYDYDGLDIEERIEDLRGNIGRGTCLYCGAENVMKYEGHICFICSKFGKSVHEDIYYYWAAGGLVELDE